MKQLTLAFNHVHIQKQELNKFNLPESVRVKSHSAFSLLLGAENQVLE